MKLDISLATFGSTFVLTKYIDVRDQFICKFRETPMPLGTAGAKQRFTIEDSRVI